MKIITVQNQELGAQQVKEIMKEQLDAGKIDMLGLATGSTMIPIYEKWVNSDLSFENVTSFNLDEQVGLDRGNKNSYSFFMNEHLFSKKKFKNTFIPNGVVEDLEEECLSYEKLLREHTLDIQFLGIGANGHIAFNEPGTSFESVTHVANLTDSTLGSNSRYFGNDEQVPITALTMGISSVLTANKIILLVFGEHKRFALEKLVEGQVTTEYPVTALINHSDVTVIRDIGNLDE